MKSASARVPVAKCPCASNTVSALQGWVRRPAPQSNIPSSRGQKSCVSCTAVLSDAAVQTASPEAASPTATSTDPGDSLDRILASSHHDGSSECASTQPMQYFVKHMHTYVKGQQAMVPQLPTECTLEEDCEPGLRTLQLPPVLRPVDGYTEGQLVQIIWLAGFATQELPEVAQLLQGGEMTLAAAEALRTIVARNKAARTAAREPCSVLSMPQAFKLLRSLLRLLPSDEAKQRQVVLQLLDACCAGAAGMAHANHEHDQAHQHGNSRRGVVPSRSGAAPDLQQSKHLLRGHIEPMLLPLVRECGVEELSRLQLRMQDVFGGPSRELFELMGTRLVQVTGIAAVDAPRRRTKAENGHTIEAAGRMAAAANHQLPALVNDAKTTAPTASSGAVSAEVGQAELTVFSNGTVAPASGAASPNKAASLFHEVHAPLPSHASPQAELMVFSNGSIAAGPSTARPSCEQAPLAQHAVSETGSISREGLASSVIRRPAYSAAAGEAAQHTVAVGEGVNPSSLIVTAEQVGSTISLLTAWSFGSGKLPASVTGPQLGALVVQLTPGASDRQVADLLRLSAILQAEFDSTQAATVADAVMWHMWAFGAGSLTRVLSALSTLRSVVHRVDRTALGKAFAAQAPNMPARGVANGVINMSYLVTKGSLAEHVDMDVIGTQLSQKVLDMAPGELCALLKSLTFHRVIPTTLDHQQVGKAVQHMLPTMSARQLVPVLRYFAHVGRIPRTVSHAALDEMVLKLLSELHGPGLDTVCRLASRIGRLPAAIEAERFGAVFMARLPQLSNAELQMVLSTLCRLPQLPKSVKMEAVAREVHKRVPHLDKRSRVNILWAFSKLRCWPRLLQEAEYERTLVDTLPILTHKDFAHCLWAVSHLVMLGKLPIDTVKHPAYYAQLRSRSPSFNPHDLVQCMLALQMLPEAALPDALDVPELAEHVVGSVGNMTARQLALVLAAILSLPGSAWLDVPLIRKVEVALLAKLPPCDAPAACATLDRRTAMCREQRQADLEACSARACCPSDERMASAVRTLNPDDRLELSTALVHLVSAMSARRYRPSSCTINLYMTQVLHTVRSEPLSAAFALTALSKLRVRLPLNVTQTLWQPLLAYAEKMQLQAQRTPDESEGAVTRVQQVVLPVRNAIWATCTMYGEAPEELQQLVPLLRSAEAAVEDVPIEKAIYAKQVLLANAILVSLYGVEHHQQHKTGPDSGSGTSRAPSISTTATLAAGKPQQPGAAANGVEVAAPLAALDETGLVGDHVHVPASLGPPQAAVRPMAAARAGSLVYSTRTLAQCNRVWMADARQPLPNSFQSSVADVAGKLFPDARIRQSISLLEGGLLRGNLICDLHSTATGREHSVVLSCNRDNRYLANEASVLDGPLAVRAALLQRHAYDVVHIQQSAWDALQSEEEQLAYLYDLFKAAGLA